MSAPPRWRRTLFSALRIVVIAYLGLAILVFSCGDRLIFHPSRYPAGDWTVPKGASDVFFTTRDGTKLHGWWAPKADSNLTVLVMHGNAGSIAGRQSLISDFGSMGASVLLFDYRGFGRSEGAPSEAGMYEDADAAWRFLVEVKEVGPSSIVLLGQSLGSSPALHLALRRICRAVVLEAPFSCIGDMAARVIPFPPLGWALNCRFDNCEMVAKLRRPLVIVQGTKDEVVPSELVQRVFDCAREPKKLVRIENGGHNDLWDVGRETYLSAMTWAASIRNTPVPAN